MKNKKTTSFILLLAIALLASGTALAEGGRSFYRVVDLEGTGKKDKAAASIPPVVYQEPIATMPSPVMVEEETIESTPANVPPVSEPVSVPEPVAIPEAVIEMPVAPMVASTVQPPKINSVQPMYQRYTRPNSSLAMVNNPPTITPAVTPELPPPVSLPDDVTQYIHPPAPVVVSLPPIRPDGLSNNYILGAGDVLRVTVYGDDNLSGEFIIDASGSISMPLIQEVSAMGLTTRALENTIIARLTPQYLTDAKVSVQVIEYRSVYVMGEVRLPGKYPYVPNMTMLQAVAVAGGHTYRANEETAEISRQNNGAVERITATADTLIMPGDTVVVKRRWF